MAAITNTITSAQALCIQATFAIHQVRTRECSPAFFDTVAAFLQLNGVTATRLPLNQVCAIVARLTRLACGACSHLSCALCATQLAALRDQFQTKLTQPYINQYCGSRAWTEESKFVSTRCAVEAGTLRDRIGTKRC